jgi:hypothetical protein
MNQWLTVPIAQSSPLLAGAANTANTAATNTSTCAHVEEKNEDIPIIRPLYLFIIPVLCLMELNAGSPR